MFEVITLNAANVETARVSIRNIGEARFHAKGLLYTEGTVKVLIKKNGEKFEGYELSKSGKADFLIF